MCPASVIAKPRKGKHDPESGPSATGKNSQPIHNEQKVTSFIFITDQPFTFRLRVLWPSTFLSNSGLCYMTTVTGICIHQKEQFRKQTRHLRKEEPQYRQLFIVTRLRS